MKYQSWDSSLGCGRHLFTFSHTLPQYHKLLVLCKPLDSRALISGIFGWESSPESLRFLRVIQ